MTPDQRPARRSFGEVLCDLLSASFSPLADSVTPPESEGSFGAVGRHLERALARIQPDDLIRALPSEHRLSAVHALTPESRKRVSNALLWEVVDALRPPNVKSN